MKKIFCIFSLLLISIGVFAAEPAAPTAPKVDWEQFWSLILGNVTLTYYLASYVFVFIGLFFRAVYKTRDAIKKNAETPNKFSLKYWIKDNLLTKLLSFILNFFAAYLSLRFSSDWFGVEVSMGFAVVVGLCIDWFVDFIKKLQPPVAKAKESANALQS